MKRIIRATIGIGATIAIIFLVERTMASFGFFDKPEEEIAAAKADSVATAKQELIELQKRVNDVLKGDALIEVGEKTRTVKRIYKNPIFAKDEYMHNFEHPDSTVEHKQVVEVTFELEESLVDEIGFLFIEGFNVIDSKPKVKYFQPRTGPNRLRVKTNFPAGKHQFRAGYCLKSDALKNAVRFYSQSFDVVID